MICATRSKLVHLVAALNRPYIAQIQDLGPPDFMATGQIKSDVDLNEDSFHGD